MDDMDIDQVVEVPDTPDRLASQNINGKICIRRERHVSSIGSLIENADMPDAGLKGGPRNNKRATKSDSRSIFLPPRNGYNKSDLQGNIVNIASGPALSSRAVFNSRRTEADLNFNHRGKSSIQTEYLGKGKALSSSHSEIPGCQGHVKVHDLTKDDDHFKICQKFVTESSQSKEHRKEMSDNSVSPLLIAEDSDFGKKVDNLKTSHRTSFQRKLVRNGCISPLNVAKAKLSAEKQNNTFLHSHQDYSGTSRESMAEVKDSCRVEGNGCISPLNVAKAKQSAHKQNNTFQHPYQNDSGSSRELMDEDKVCRRVKGKGLLSHSRLLKESEAKTRPLSGRNSEGASGWISTHEHTRRSNPSLSDKEPLLSRRADDPCNVNKLPRTVVVGRDNKDRNITRKHSIQSQNVSAAPIVQTVSQKHQGCRLNEHHDPSNTVIKRQRQGSSRSHQGESSSSAIATSELVVLGSPGEPSNVRSIRLQNSHTPIIDIDEFSPETRSNGSRNISCSNRIASDIRDRQLEADEMLARELQEQLYNESNVAADHAIDEQFALALQQENLHHGFASRSQHISHPRSSSVSNLRRENVLRSSRNSSTQRVTQPRVPTSTRMARLRGRFLGQPRTVSSRQRNVVFPPNMDVDMRMHILETLEAFNDMGMAGSLLHAQRDFNENDYDMLLALDENNHQHGGASAAQINALPESTVQTDNLEECSICLETPSIGDTIRHLPCLHKFHKDCIDEWVRRKTSCPICKSSVT
ncbi:E3 ubiquitin-protein like [Heracleum sosnowskyi]|uniref:E3 ubiquitin-protein like n=1 Tax=Heracleum sosnowskyi TaxID=360622 RepID=A0AAD8H848_9APIA|nr:E3 ubiquitin-protein like [Heracleum sosnowskyi]